ncbi:MAG: hypothetical protein PHF29_00365 [Candidatus Riflebacteria bacterium]|nr:hypothetical protein [Candidatus Riflebacteria bacterium]MDD3000190.1 hypothetical protein [Candidatus Riflebacteria bacterium]
MGWLWNSVHDFFDIKDGTFPEICINGLNTSEVISGYNLIRKSASSLIGRPTLQTIETKSLHGIDELGNAADLVCKRKVYPFHFMVSDLNIKKFGLYELGIFIFENGIALDIERGPLWGEREMMCLFMLIIKIKGSSSSAFIRLEEHFNKEYQIKFEEVILRLLSPNPEIWPQ